ncbi:unnamed protein product [Discosporangium mesarthrocarpum]
MHFNALLWHILQALPADPTLVAELRSLRRAEEEGWESLLDPSSLYKMIYSLQVVDAFCTARFNLATKQGLEAALAWALHFRHLGGMERLVFCLNVICKQMRKTEGFERGSRFKLEARTLAVALLSRVLHHLLQLEEDYHKAREREREGASFVTVQKVPPCSFLRVYSSGASLPQTSEEDDLLSWPLA